MLRRSHRTVGRSIAQGSSTRAGRPVAKHDQVPRFGRRGEGHVQRDRRDPRSWHPAAAGHLQMHAATGSHRGLGGIDPDTGVQQAGRTQQSEPSEAVTAAAALTGAELANNPATIHADSNATTVRKRSLRAKAPSPSKEPLSPVIGM